MERPKPKQRNHRDDGLPGTLDEWHRMPAAVEQAFRRGYQQGMTIAIQALEAGITASELEGYTYGPLRRWRFADKMRYGVPPAIPGWT